MHTSLTPTLSFLASALKLAAADAATERAADRAVQYLAAGPAYEFDGSELRVVSFSRGDAVWHITDGISCTCEGGKRPMCRHRALFRLLLAEAVLRDPLIIRAQIRAQFDDADDAGDAFDDAAPGAGPRPRLQDMQDW